MLAACKTLARRLGHYFAIEYTRQSEYISSASLQQSFPTARTSACCETARARTLSLKTQHRSPSRHSRARGARARDALHTCLTPRNSAQHHISLPRRHARTDEPHHARAFSQHGRRPVTTTTSASPQLMTTKHERRTSPRQCVHTILQSSPSRRMGLSALRKFFSDSCLEKPGLV